MAEPIETRVCTWNIQWGRGRDTKVDLDRIVVELESIDAAVVCLQEVAVNHPGLPGRPLGDQAAALASMLPGYEAIYAAGSDLADGQGGRRQFGEMILSRFPVRQVFRHRLPWPADPSAPSMPRVALEAVVAAPPGPLRVVTTHLEFYSGRQRRAQVEALRDLYAEGWGHAKHPASPADADPPFAVLPRGEVALICGDFNFGPDAFEYGRLQEPFGGDAERAPRLRDAWTLVDPQLPHPPTTGLVRSEFIPAPVCFDFFFVSENLAKNVTRIAVDPVCEASDHQPVILGFRFRCGNDVSMMESK